MSDNDGKSSQCQDADGEESPGSAGPAYHHGDLRRALLREAVSQVAEHGIEGLSLRQISVRAGVSHTAAYHHFPGRAALMTAITADAFTDLAAALRPCQDLPGTPVDRLTALGVAYVTFAATHRGQFLVMWRPELRDHARENDVVTAGDAANEIIRAAVQDCHDQAPGLPYDPGPMTIGAWAMAHGIAALTVDGPLAKWMTSPADLTALATTIIRSTAESIYRAAPGGTVHSEETKKLSRTPAQAGGAG